MAVAIAIPVGRVQRPRPEQRIGVGQSGGVSPCPRPPIGLGLHQPGADDVVTHQNAFARVLPFEQKVVDLKLESCARVAVNAAKLAAIGGGGTNVSAPLARLNAERAAVDLVVIVSDNQSWVDATRGGATATMTEWDKLVKRNPQAKLICIDLQPYGSTQASGRPEILNVGGFSDSVFDTIARFVSGEARDWVETIRQVEL